MIDRYAQILPPIAIVVVCLFAGYIAIYQPGYANNYYYLGGLIVLQVVLACLWNYRERFFALLMVVFFWAGSDVPLRSVWTSGRWFVLAAGALVGFVIYMRDRRHQFGIFHLAALLCGLAALISALVSSFPTLASFKAFSLFLLFLYGTSGARLAVIGRENRFFPGLLLGCETLVYYRALVRFIPSIDDNPNTVGALMGVVALPLLLWGILVSQQRTLHRRRVFAFALGLLVLLSSYSRAGIVAGMVGCVLLCVGLRRYRLLMKGIALFASAIVLVAAVIPTPWDQSGQITSPDSVGSIFLYKGHRTAGVLGSRRTIWDQTVAVIRQNPWFGTGFGTTTAEQGATQQVPTFSSNTKTTREHGNSYLAIAEWVGLLGVLPFLTLVLLVAVNIARVARWMRRNGSPSCAAVPIAAILAAGLVHAAFEDWLFAVGYPLCVFFWAMAFVLVDVLPATAPAAAPASVASSLSQSWTGRWGFASSSQ